MKLLKKLVFAKIFQAIIQLLGRQKTIKVFKQLIRILEPNYAFPITWWCLSKLPLNSETELEYTYGSIRGFPLTKIKVNPKCLHARFFTMSGYYEEFLTKEILSPKRKGLLIDIGANFGYYSVLWLQKNQTKVIAVEPAEEYVKILYENLQQYKSRYAVFNGCIGDRDGEAFLDTLGDPTMLSKVVVDGNKDRIRKVWMLTLNSLLEKYNEEHIDVLKIDAEGYDIKILESCKPLFAAKIIKTVFWEIANTAEEKNIVEFLEALGYSRILDKEALGYELQST